MEYSTSLQSPSLGNSQIQGILVSNLNNQKYNVEKKETNIVFEPKGQFFAPLADNNDYGFLDTSNNNENQQEEKEEKNQDEGEGEDRFKFVKHPINSFFIGSITVVGLFILYRLLQKNK